MQFDPKAKPTKKIEIEKPSGPNQMEDLVFDPKRKPEDMAQLIISDKKAGTGLIPAWSPSALKTFETCRWRSYLQKVVKLETEDHPAAARGTAIHDAAEHYVDGTDGEWDEAAKPKKLEHFQDDFDELRELYAEAKVELEGEWSFTTEWEATGWKSKDAWARMKLDALRWHTPEHGLVIDYKSGRKFGNEVAHADQAMIYTVATFMRYPEAQLLDTSFWYLDQAEKSFPQRFTRKQAMTFLPRIADRATIMTSAVEEDFKPSPSIYNCRWCDFNREEGCDWRFIG